MNQALVHLLDPIGSILDLPALGRLLRTDQGDHLGDLITQFLD